MVKKTFTRPISKNKTTFFGLGKKLNEGKSTSGSKHIACADVLNGKGIIESLKKWSLLEEGKNNYYNVNTRKSYLILKEHYKDKAKEIFKDTNIKRSTEGHQHLN